MHYTVSYKPAEYLVLFQIKTPQSHRILYFSISTDFLCLFAKRKGKQRAALKHKGTLKWFVNVVELLVKISQSPCYVLTIMGAFMQYLPEK